MPKFNYEFEEKDHHSGIVILSIEISGYKTIKELNGYSQELVREFIELMDVLNDVASELGAKYDLIEGGNTGYPKDPFFDPDTDEVKIVEYIAINDDDETTWFMDDIWKKAMREI